jgi:hypothetical protein
MHIIKVKCALAPRASLNTRTDEGLQRARRREQRQGGNTDTPRLTGRNSSLLELENQAADRMLMREQQEGGPFLELAAMCQTGRQKP